MRLLSVSYTNAWWCFMIYQTRSYNTADIFSTKSTRYFVVFPWKICTIYIFFSIYLTIWVWSLGYCPFSEMKKEKNEKIWTSYLCLIWFSHLIDYLLDLLSLISYCFLVCLLPYLVEQAGDETVCFLDDEIVLSDDEVRAFDDLEGEVLVEDDLHEVGKSVSVLFNFIL